MTDQGLSVNNLVVQRGGRTVLHDVSIAIRPGEVTCMLGANGAGKSSLVMAIAGELPVTSGTITAQGVVLNGKPAYKVRRSGIAVIPEGHRVLSDLTVRENLMVSGSHLNRRELSDEIDKALQLFPELKQHLNVSAAAISGGQKQMVSLSQGLISQPKFLLIDELSLGLAPAIVLRLGAALTNIAQTGISVFLIEQFTSLALSLTQNAYVMERGRIVFEGSSQTLKDKPRILHAAYLSSDE